MWIERIRDEIKCFTLVKLTNFFCSYSSHFGQNTLKFSLLSTQYITRNQKFDNYTKVKNEFRLEFVIISKVKFVLVDNTSDGIYIHML